MRRAEDAATTEADRNIDEGGRHRGDGGDGGNRKLYGFKARNDSTPAVTYDGGGRG